MLNKFNNFLSEVGLNPKKEILIITISNLLCILLTVFVYFFTRQIILSLLTLLSFVVINFIHYFRYSGLKKKLVESREDEFVTVISYFQIFINNRFNVYQCFQNTLPYVSSWMKEKIESFLHQIDEDKSIKPFIVFASNFKNAVAHNVMLSIYQMIDEGESNAHMMQFSLLFENLSQIHHKNLIDRKEKSLSSLSMFPLIGAGLITLIITFNVILIMGDMINVA